MYQVRCVNMYVIIILFLFSCPLTLAETVDNDDIQLLNKTGDAIAQIAGQAAPAVVSVSIEKTVEVKNPIDENDLGDLLEKFFGPNFFDNRGQGNPYFRFKRPSPENREVIRGLGSGFIVESSGYIITNNHVVSGAQTVTVKLVNGREYTAKVIGTDAPTDLAVVKLDAGENLPTLQLGDSDTLKVGHWVIAIGNPFGLTSTITVGVASAKGRAGIGIEDYEDFIQTDAAINVGNSGGPLLNANGKVIGINTAIVSGSGGSVGIGFAIPSNMAKMVYEQLKEKGSVTRGYIGIGIQPLTAALGKYFNISAKEGVLISQVMDDSPGQKAGLKQGDVIIKINGDDIQDIATFRNKVAMTKPGTKIQLTIIRNGKEKTVSVKTGQMPTEARPKVMNIKPEGNIGLTVQDLTSGLADRLGLKGQTGVVITSVKPDSPAEKAGLQPGMLIRQVGQEPVTDVEQFQEEVQKEIKKGAVLLLVSTKDFSQYVLIELK